MQSNTLTESQCKIIKKYLPESERKRKHDLREIFDALFYILKTGCHWRMLPNNYPKWELVYYYYSKWRDEELFVHLNDMIRETVRIISNKRAQCSVAIIDSQSVKTTRRGGLRGVDGNKRIAAAIFIWYLFKNELLFDINENKLIDDNTIIGMTLIIAESDPKERDMIIKVLTNLF